MPRAGQSRTAGEEAGSCLCIYIHNRWSEPLVFIWIQICPRNMCFLYTDNMCAHQGSITDFCARNAQPHECQCMSTICCVSALLVVNVLGPAEERHPHILFQHTGPGSTVYIAIGFGFGKSHYAYDNYTKTEFKMWRIYVCVFMVGVGVALPFEKHRG